MMERGNEFGTTTGRQRRCGWLDLVALRYAVRLSGVTQLALTKLDVLSGFERVRICEAYRTREGERITDFPYHQTVFHGCRPIYREMPGLGRGPLRVPLPGRAAAARPRLRRADRRGPRGARSRSSAPGRAATRSSTRWRSRRAAGPGADRLGSVGRGGAHRLRDGRLDGRGRGLGRRQLDRSRPRRRGPAPARAVSAAGASGSGQGLLRAGGAGAGVCEARGSAWAAVAWRSLETGRGPARARRPARRRPPRGRAPARRRART